MKICSNCHYKNDDDKTFCSNCGKPLEKSREEKDTVKRSQPAPSKPNKKRYFAITAAVVVVLLLVAGGITSYKYYDKNYSEEAVKEQFMKALMTKDKETIRKLLVPSDSRIKVNDDSIEALLLLVETQPSVTETISDSLYNRSLEDATFYVKKSGKFMLVFNKYAIDTTGYFIEGSSTAKDTTVYINDGEIGTLESEDEEIEFGPYLAGEYTLEGVRTYHSEKVKDAVTVDLIGTDDKTDVKLDTVSDEEKEEAKQAAIEKAEQEQAEKEAEEAEKAAAEEQQTTTEIRIITDDYFVLPSSSYEYLTNYDVEGLSQAELRIARNEIFARHGYVFKKEDLKVYFESQAWYSPDPDYDGEISTIEKANVELIKSYEKN